MGTEHTTRESFSEKLDRYTATIQTGDLSAEAMQERDTIKKELLHLFFSKNSNHEKLLRAVEEINKLDSNLFSEKMKQELIEVKLCAFEIADHLDPMHINNYAMIETIVAEKLGQSHTNTENHAQLSKSLAWYADTENREIESMVKN